MSEPRSHAPFTPDCWCNGPPITHGDDSYGDCITCREYVHHTEDEMRHVAFPCAVVREAEAERITPQQRAVLERVDYIRVVMLSEQRRSDEGQRDLWVAEMLTAAHAAVDALLEAER